MQSIRVVSSMPGSGKTSWCFKHLADRQNERWIFVSPYLKECGGMDSKTGVEEYGRIRQELPQMNFKNPKALHGGDTKTKSFKRLIESGDNIATTHQLWRMLDSDCAEIIKDMEYNIVIDESLNLIQTYEAFDQYDIRVALRGGMVAPCEDNKLQWNNKDYPNYKGSMLEIKQLCDIGALYLYGEEVVIHQVPPQVILSAKEVIVLTYGFKDSVMGAWCDVCGIPYYIDTTVKLYKSNDEIINELRERINLIEIPKVFMELDDKSKGGVFTKGWFEHTMGEYDQKRIKAAIANSVKKKFDKGNIFWTTFKDYKSKLQGVRYTRAKTIELDGNTWKREPFVAKNMRASNEYRDCTNCIYLVDVRMNPYLHNYLKKGGAKHFKEDNYSLLEMVQLIFRGAVRNTEDDPLGNHLNLLVGSPRMYCLLESWLNGDIQID